MPRIDDMTTGIPRTELNILFLIETSSSYDQLTREKINEFYNKMLVKLRNVSCDFFCKIAIAHFSEQISWIEPEFTEIQKVQYKPINFDGTTNISNMFDRINKKLSKDSLLKDIIYFSRPVIIFISDGHFDYKSSEEFVQLLNNKWYRRSQRICFYASSNPNFEHLNDIVVGNGAIACIDDENAVDTLIEEKIQEINIVSPTFDLEEDHKWNRLINKFKPKIIGKINRIVRLRINSDGDGVRSVVFLQNCPLSCSWCCNPETRFGKKFYEKDTDELYELIKRDIPYFDYSEGGSYLYWWRTIIAV